MAPVGHSRLKKCNNHLMNSAMAFCSSCCAAIAFCDSSGVRGVAVRVVPTTRGTKDVATDIGTPPEVNAASTEERITDAAMNSPVTDGVLAVIILDAASAIVARLDEGAIDGRLEVLPSTGVETTDGIITEDDEAT